MRKHKFSHGFQRDAGRVSIVCPSVRWFLAVVCVCHLMMGAFRVSAETYTLNDALKLIGTEEGRVGSDRIEVTLDIDLPNIFTLLNLSHFSSEGGKTVILWREGPSKAYEKSERNFTNSYLGTDIGETKIYLCADLMEKMPPVFRPQSSDEIRNILFVDSFYLYHESIKSTTGASSSDDPSAPPATTVYYPLFGWIGSVCLYNVDTNSFGLWDAISQKPIDLRANPEAADLWQGLQSLHNTLTAIVQVLFPDGIPEEAISTDAPVYSLTVPNPEETMAAISAILAKANFSSLPQDTVNQLQDCLQDKDISSIIRRCNETYWELAKDFQPLDPEAAEIYAQAIALHSYRAMESIVQARGYDNVTMSLADIEETRSYMGKPDTAYLEETLEAVVNDITEYTGWDMEFINLFFSL